MTRLFLPVLLVIICLVACEQENYNDSDFLVSETFTDSNIRVVTFDTLAINTSTIKFDSLITEEADRILIGSYVDSIFGKIKASTFFEMEPSTYSIDDDATYDSITLKLKYDQYYYNDTLQTNHIRVKRLVENVTPYEDYFYNTTDFGTYEEDLAVFAYEPMPIRNDSLIIKLDDNLGIELFDKFQNHEITDQDEFRDFFNGLSLQPDENDDGAIIGFSKSTDDFVMQLHYSVPEVDEQLDETLNINLSQTGNSLPFFIQILAEDPIEELGFLTDQDYTLASTDINNQMFMQSGVGLASKIEFPDVKSIYGIQGDGTLISASLTFHPKPQSYDDILKIRDTLDVYIADASNNLVEQLTLDGYNPALAIMNRDEEEFGNIYYEVSISSFIDDILTTEYDLNRSLILLPQDYNSSIDRYILNGSYSENYNAKINITYAVYNEQDN